MVHKGRVLLSTHLKGFVDIRTIYPEITPDLKGHLKTREQEWLCLFSWTHQYKNVFDMTHCSPYSQTRETWSISTHGDRPGLWADA